MLMKPLSGQLVSPTSEELGLERVVSCTRKGGEHDDGQERA
jgi:hypothetical protein